MYEQSDTLEEWARWKVLEVALEANGEISRARESDQLLEDLKLLDPVLESVSVTVGVSEVVAPAGGEALGGKDCLIIHCDTREGAIMRLAYELCAPGTP